MHLSARRWFFSLHAILFVEDGGWGVTAQSTEHWPSLSFGCMGWVKDKRIAWRTNGEERSGSWIMQMNDEDCFVGGIERYGIGMDTGRWISGEQIQWLSGIKGARGLTSEENGSDGKWYSLHRYRGSGGNHTWVRDPIQHATCGWRDTVETTLSRVNGCLVYGHRRSGYYWISWWMIGQWRKQTGGSFIDCSGAVRSKCGNQRPGEKGGDGLSECGVTWIWLCRDLRFVLRAWRNRVHIEFWRKKKGGGG